MAKVVLMMLSMLLTVNEVMTWPAPLYLRMMISAKYPQENSW